MIARFVLLLRMAFRNLLANRINLAVGLLIMGGTLFFVVLGALLNTLNTSMARSVTSSLSGDIQIYSAKSRDELSLFGSFGRDSDLEVIRNFPHVAEELHKIPEIKSIIPMGLSGAVITTGNIVDVTLERLRALVRAKKRDGSDPALEKIPAPELDRRIQLEVDHLQQIIKVLAGDVSKAREMLTAEAVEPQLVEALKRANDPAFWKNFAADPYAALEFLENRVAPEVSDAQLLFIRYMGTDLAAFKKSFERMEIIDGTAVPEGRRGFLIPKFFYESQLKLKNAYRLDRIKEQRNEKKRIAKDATLERFVTENQNQTRDIVLQLNSEQSSVMAQKLRDFFHRTDGELEPLLKEFFKTTDENFDERYQYFYKEIAPMIELYKIRIGDVITIRAFTQSGASKAVNLKVYGSFGFRGLEKSPIAGQICLMDIMSFRDLYGYATAESKSEVAELQKSIGSTEVRRENAEDELFGGGEAATVAETKGANFTEDLAVSGRNLRERSRQLLERVYTPEEMSEGVVLNAGIFVKDPRDTDKVIARIEALSAAEGLDLKATGWQNSVGTFGQLIVFLRGLLMFIIFIIFTVAIIIINNAMMMATIQRTEVIGTLRAIGATKSTVLTLILLETITLASIFGALGVLLGVFIVKLLAWSGIRAFNDVAYFFFSGPVLKPEISAGSIIAAAILIFIVAIVSTIVPAIIATRISPLRAMQSSS